MCEFFAVRHLCTTINTQEPIYINTPTYILLLLVHGARFATESLFYEYTRIPIDLYTQYEYMYTIQQQALYAHLFCLLVRTKYRSTLLLQPQQHNNDKNNNNSSNNSKLTFTSVECSCEGGPNIEPHARIRL